MTSRNDDANRRHGDAKARRTHDDEARRDDDTGAGRTGNPKSRRTTDAKSQHGADTESRDGGNTRSRNDGDTRASQDGGEARLAPTTVGIADVVVNARRTMAALTGHSVDSVTSARRSKEGWQVRLELVELERIPATTSVLGSYEVTLDGDGELLGYGRTRRYYRNQASEDDEE